MRTTTPPRRNDDGTTTHTVQRTCNGCGQNIGDANETEINALIYGDPLPDVRLDCPACSLPSLACLVEIIEHWHQGAFPDDTIKDLGLSLGEECGEVQRTILKEGHGVNDRRAGTDWKAERYHEAGDVLIGLAKLAAIDGFDLTRCLIDRFAYVIGRYPGTNGAASLDRLIDVTEVDR